MNSSIVRFFALSLAATALTACPPSSAKSKAVNAPAGEAVSITVSSDEIAELAGTRLNVPHGALTTDVKLTVAYQPGDILETSDEAAGPVADFGPPGTVFQIPATITLPVTLSSTQLPSSLYVAVLENDGRRTTIEGGALQYNAETSTVKFEVSGFTRFQAGARHLGAHDVDGGDSLDAGRIASFSQFVSELSNSHCGRMRACGRTDEVGMSRCIADINALLWNSGRQIERGLWRPDYDQVYACINAMDAQPCDVLLPNFVSIGQCASRLFAANARIGERCDISRQCVSSASGGRSICWGAFCSATCVATTRLAGQPCDQTTGCAPGLFCGTDSLCKDPLPLGSSCEGLDSRVCGLDASCKSGTCTALPTMGQPCSTISPRCDRQSYCSTSNICAPLKPAGDACKSSMECADKNFCIDGVCTMSDRLEGETCRPSTCAGGLACDPITRTCTSYEAPYPLNAPCTINLCTSPQLCVGDKVNPDGGVGIVGTCVTPTLGGPCESQSCPAGSYCSSDQICRESPAAGGNSCASSQQCAPNFMCWNSKCEAIVLVPTGQPCGKATEACATAKDVCRFESMLSDGGLRKTCRPAGAAGDSCYGFGSSDPECLGGACGGAGGGGGGAFECLYPNTCIDGTCTPSGSLGQPCSSRDGCIGSVCMNTSMPNPDGGASLKRSICGKRKAGEFCVRALECESSQCDLLNSVCIDACQ